MRTYDPAGKAQQGSAASAAPALLGHWKWVTLCLCSSAALKCAFPVECFEDQQLTGKFYV